MVEGTFESLKVEIDNIKEDIKEIKVDSKETNKFFREVIDSLKENSIKQTEILSNHEKQFAQVNKDISELKDDLDTNLHTQTKWYQEFLNNHFGLVFKVLFVLILLLAGVKLAGVDLSNLFGK